MQLIIADVIPKFVTIHSKLHVPSGYYSVYFPVFCFSFSAFRCNDFGVKPVPSLQESGKLFWDARIISGSRKHNLPCSFEHEFFIRKMKRWRSKIASFDKLIMKDKYNYRKNNTSQDGSPRCGGHPRHTEVVTLPSVSVTLCVYHYQVLFSILGYQ